MRSPATLLGTPRRHQAPINVAGGVFFHHRTHQFGIVHIAAVILCMEHEKRLGHHRRKQLSAESFLFFFQFKNKKGNPICENVSV